MLTTPFHSREGPLCFASEGGPAQWNGWDPYIIPDRYDDYEVEYRAVREAAGAIDMSALWKVEVSGPDATIFMNYLTPRDITRMSVGRIFWTPLCSERGKVAGDGPLVRLEENRYWFSSYPMDQWFKGHAQGIDVEIRVFTDDFGILALQGPTSRDVLNAATRQEWSDLGFLRARSAEIGGVQVEVFRTGFTGELGYELWVPRDGAIVMWDELFEAGSPHGLKAVGHSVNHILRVEAGLLVPAIDYSPDASFEEGDYQHIRGAGGEPSSPGEVGMGHAIHLDKAADFVGKSALLAERESGGPTRQQVGVEIDPRDVIELYLQHERCPSFNCQTRVFAPPLSVFRNSNRVGRASSVVWSVARRQLIGLASISKSSAVPGTAVWVEWPISEGATGRVAARVAELPFQDDRRSPS